MSTRRLIPAALSFVAGPIFGVALALTVFQPPSLLCDNHKIMASAWSSAEAKDRASRSVDSTLSTAVTHDRWQRLVGEPHGQVQSDCPECDRVLARKLGEN
jgi:hypothetical protein